MNTKSSCTYGLPNLSLSLCAQLARTMYSQYRIFSEAVYNAIANECRTYPPHVRHCSNPFTCVDSHGLHNHPLSRYCRDKWATQAEELLPCPRARGRRWDKQDGHLGLVLGSTLWTRKLCCLLPTLSTWEHKGLIGSCIRDS